MWLDKALKVMGKEKSASSSNSAFSDTAPSWNELKTILSAKQTELGMDLDPDHINGPPNPYALERRFNKSVEPDVVLYRDHAAWCPYCQKIWLQLEEKRIPYRVEKINMRCYGDKPESFLRMMPSGQVPVAMIGGRVVADSASIARELEQRFPERPLLPAEGSAERQAADGLMRLERALFGKWMQWLTSGWNHEGLKQDFCKTLDLADKHLRSQGPFFLGADISLVDINFVPFLERMVASLLYYKGLNVRDPERWPGVCRWFEAMEQRPSYIATRGDFYSHVHDLPPQLGGCAPHPDGSAAAKAIDGVEGSSWRLPLPPLSGASFEPYSPGENPPVDMTEAAAKLIGNHEAIVRFAARGCGRPGPRPVSAPLSDPTAQPGVEHIDAVDAGLRHVAHALLVGVEGKQISAGALQVAAKGSGYPTGPMVDSASYLRDRVGVPRDLKLPAARQLRAHLNWLIDELESA
uniref:Glutathione S-transferase n=1 Tax=Tetraselmis sp. GSL018 TaxID=582737 RepID=A0A061QXR9_9CHLO|eukprot:CAMPEP_0177612284 /NCGR_PEP_ID=MMETSP0419_2-20121207/21112_1 /TAXON_ID=582737 /ORGANISM="Tetraselmis sp., Strain GSL018" /LENGTH=464 /DNA_ID=CAMNT_0019108409 /DNA_START=152 /DNA_END=1546 /DNA_ORIENTATION=+